MSMMAPVIWDTDYAGMQKKGKEGEREEGRECACVLSCVRSCLCVCLRACVCACVRVWFLFCMITICVKTNIINVKTYQNGIHCTVNNTIHDFFFVVLKICFGYRDPVPCMCNRR